MSEPFEAQDKLKLRHAKDKELAGGRHYKSAEGESKRASERGGVRMADNRNESLESIRVALATRSA